MTTTDRSGAVFAGRRAGDVDVDALFDVLSDPRRRFLVDCLGEHGRPLAVADAARELANWECEAPRGRVSDDQVASCQVSLRHVHVPKLVDAGVLERDGDEETIALTDAFAEPPGDTDPVCSVLTALREVA